MDLMQPKGTGHAFKLPCWRDAAMHAILLPLETNAKMKAWIVKAAPEPYAPGQPAEGLWAWPVRGWDCCAAACSCAGAGDRAAAAVSFRQRL
ncbi:MAG: hypothetical protein DUD31_04185 [Coriobacteriaceae bacterium]|nr:MAG: hypothetical protein DUD31_04185 [Coriobacteriaceae bacterium]